MPRLSRLPCSAGRQGLSPALSCLPRLHPRLLSAPLRLLSGSLLFTSFQFTIKASHWQHLLNLLLIFSSFPCPPLVPWHSRILIFGLIHIKTHAYGFPTLSISIPHC